jgi:hypothetical protein
MRALLTVALLSMASFTFSQVNQQILTESDSAIMINETNLNDLDIDVIEVKILHAYPSLFSNSTAICVYYGQQIEASATLRDQNRKVRTFRGVADVMNYFSQRGWEYYESIVIEKIRFLVFKKRP